MDGSRSQGRGIQILIAPVQNTGCYIPAPTPSPPLQEMGGIPLEQEESRAPVPAGALPCSIHPPESLDSRLPPSLSQDQKVPHSFILRPHSFILRNYPGTHSLVEPAQDQDLPAPRASYTRVGVDRPLAKTSLTQERPEHITLTSEPQTLAPLKTSIFVHMWECVCEAVPRSRARVCSTLAPALKLRVSYLASLHLSFLCVKSEH